jgi:hypothetical protein
VLDHGQLESVRMLTSSDMDSKTPVRRRLARSVTLRRVIMLGVLDQRFALR